MSRSGFGLRGTTYDAEARDQVAVRWQCNSKRTWRCFLCLEEQRSQVESSVPSLGSPTANAGADYPGRGPSLPMRYLCAASTLSVGSARCACGLMITKSLKP